MDVKWGWDPLFISEHLMSALTLSLIYRIGVDLSEGRITNNREPSNKGSHTKEVQAGMDPCTVSFLFLCCCGLDDENSLDEK